ncbi:MAG: 4Fe-4S binding protein [Proteobacteria bacterium]|nr:4Fe-4S binding protein [Pseudomonadota bacterium]
MKQFLTLSRIRLTVQVAMLVFTVYGGALVGHYLSDKVTGSLPALSCAYDQENSAYCVLIPLQHQLHHRVGQSIVKFQQFSFDYLIPMAFTMLNFLLFFAVLNKAFCGWICPLGTVQELINKVGRRLSLPLRRFRMDNVGRVRPVKWLMLILLVLALPLAAGLGYTSHVMGDAYCQVCPSRMVTTLMTANTEQVATPTEDPVAFAFAALRSALFGFVLVLALAMRQPFCRICPMLALHAVFRRLVPLRLTKGDSSDRCGKCKACYIACPMDIREVVTEFGAKAFHSDCTMCGRCVEFCPDDGLLALKFGPIPLFVSSGDYMKRRSKIDKPDGTPARKKAAPGPASAG